MGRPPRITEPGLAYHILKGRVMRLPLFLEDADSLAFEHVLAKSPAAVPQSVAWGIPVGAESWKRRIAHCLGLDITPRPRARRTEGDLK